MKRFAATAAAAIAALALSGLTGSAAAGGGHEGHGNGDAHGQSQSQQSQPQQQSGGGGDWKHQQKDEQKQADHQQKDQQQQDQQQQQQSPQPQQQQGSDHKVYICHATGSQSNPYVLIHVDTHALKAHTSHQDGRDIVLGSSPGSCPASAPQQAPAPAPKPTPAPEHASIQVSFCDMQTPTTGRLETKSSDQVVGHELNGTPEEARDIVPPFTVNGQTYSQLWDANGQAIFNAHCTMASTPAPAPQPQSNESEHVKVFICHATGSESNPYVLIHVDEHALKAHTRHQDGRDIVLGQSIGAGCPSASSTPQQSVQMVSFCDMESPTTGKLESKSASEVVSHELNGTPEEARDIVPAFTVGGVTYSQLWDANGQAIFNNNCTAPTQQASAPVQSSPPASTPPAAPAAPTAPAAPAAPTAPQSTGGVAGATATTPAAPAPATSAPATPAPTSAPATAAPATGGVLGTTATLTVPKAATHPSSGVLGAVGRIATGTTLPFTGLKLWVVELIALALIGLGVATRLYARGRA